MKFTVSSSTLLSLLATTGKVISNKNTLRLLSPGAERLGAESHHLRPRNHAHGLDRRGERRERGLDRRTGQTDARLAEGVPRAAAHHRRERHQLGDPHQLEERLALHSRRQPRELPGGADAQRREERAQVRPRNAGRRHQQDDLRHGGRRVAPGDERHLHQPVGKRRDVRRHRRPQTGEV